MHPILIVMLAGMCLIVVGYAVVIVFDSSNDKRHADAYEHVAMPIFIFLEIAFLVTALVIDFSDRYDQVSVEKPCIHLKTGEY